MSSPTRVIFDPKRVIDSVFELFDFTSKLGPTETISTAVVTASIWSGIDPSPSSIISGAATISGSIVSQLVVAGVLGVIYSLLCTITTNLGQTLTLTGNLAIIPVGQ